MSVMYHKIVIAVVKTVTIRNLGTKKVLQLHPTKCNLQSMIMGFIFLL